MAEILEEEDAECWDIAAELGGEETKLSVGSSRQYGELL
jgi:hypothetical protein